MKAPSAPVWVWLPDAVEPILAAQLEVEPKNGRWTYDRSYLESADSVALDPVRLHRSRRERGILLPHSDGLPGVVRDAMPAGYGADRLSVAAGRALTPLELLELGVPDSAGAIEVCGDIQRKLDWIPHELHRLREIIDLLAEGAPISRAVRLINDDASTSAGGERPKVTVQDQGKLWLAKMQDRTDVPHLPAKEFVVMTMARECGLRTPAVRLESIGDRHVFLIERFDRSGLPTRPSRSLYASAHTVLDLDPSTTPGDPRRSYLALADQLRIWCKDDPALSGHLQELWRRMAFNGLVGNSDDHPRNHGLIYRAGHWELSPAFDITPVSKGVGPVALSMATGPDGSSVIDAARLLASAAHFGVPADVAGAWLRDSSVKVANEWRARMMAAGVTKASIDGVASAFRLGEILAQTPALIDSAQGQPGSKTKRSRASRPRKASLLL